MNNNQLKLLAKMKKLINLNHKRFEHRPDRDYLKDLAVFRLTEEEAWKIILTLNANSYFPDPKPNYSTDGDTLIFKRKIQGIMAYIKLKIEINKSGEEVVCLSFHKDNKKRR